MNCNILQNLRNKLRSRVDRLNRATHDTFYNDLRLFLEFTRTQPVIRDIIGQLTAMYSSFETEVGIGASEPKRIFGDSGPERSAIAYFLLSRWGETGKDLLWKGESRLFGGLIREHAQALDMVRTTFLDPLFEYVDEHLDDARAILALLVRYKHRCEWFRRESLNELYQKGGERRLAADMYEYLHDQGLVFHIEPHSASGIPDLISMQSDDDPLVADAKVFGPTNTHGKSYLVNGFNQVYTYTRDYNQPFGYMIVFRVCGEDLKFDVSGVNLSVPYVVHNGKTIFFVVIDIHSYETSASKRGQAKCIVIDESELVQVVDSVLQSDDALIRSE